MVGARVPGTAGRVDRLPGASAAGGGHSRSRHHPECGGGPCLALEGQTRRRRRRAHLARPGLPARRSQIRVTSSISRQLIFWLAVPLMVLALCGALVHYFNSVAPGVISSDRRLKEAANALMAHVLINNGRVTVDTGTEIKPPLPAPDSIKYALRDTQGRLLAGDPQLPVAAVSSDNSQIFAMAQVDHRSLRTLVTRFDTRAGIIFITVADAHVVVEPAARFGFMSTLLWDFVQ